MRRIYLDHTATTPVSSQVVDNMTQYFNMKYGNASSVHSFGREARAALDESRDILAKYLGARSSEIVFVGGGTEANNFALKGLAWRMRENGKSHIITSKVEHHSILETCAFLERHDFNITYLDVDRFGMVNPLDVKRSIVPQTGIVSIMHANNEVGTINPINEIATITREHGVVLHTDAVQTFGKLEIDVNKLGVGLLSISAHKIYGPKGIGALYIRNGIEIEQLTHGGGQERGRRAGTENVPLAVGFAKAAELIINESKIETKRLENLRDTFRTMLSDLIPSLRFNGHPEKSLPHIINVSIDRNKLEVDGEALLFNLDLAGIAASSGSACTSGTLQPSHVLIAMGHDQESAQASVRFSMGRSTTKDELEYVAKTFSDIVKRIGKPR